MSSKNCCMQISPFFLNPILKVTWSHKRRLNSSGVWSPNFTTKSNTFSSCTLKYVRIIYVTYYNRQIVRLFCMNVTILQKITSIPQWQQHCRNSHLHHFVPSCIARSNMESRPVGWKCLPKFVTPFCPSCLVNLCLSVSEIGMQLYFKSIVFI